MHEVSETANADNPPRGIVNDFAGRLIHETTVIVLFAALVMCASILG
jgi:hypothetical protein